MNTTQLVIKTPSGITHKYHGVSIVIDQDTLDSVLGPYTASKNGYDGEYHHYVITDLKTGNPFVLVKDLESVDKWYVYAQSLMISLGCAGNICKRITNSIGKLYNVDVQGRTYTLHF